MPDKQGVSSFIGNFLNGYMGKVAQLEQEKTQNVKGMLEMADRFRQAAEDPLSSPEAAYGYRSLYQQKLSEADKEHNRSTSGLGSIMKIFGFGKKGKDGSTPDMPAEWFTRPAGNAPQQTPSAMPAEWFTRPAGNAPQETPKAMPQPGWMNNGGRSQEDLPANFRNLPEWASAGVPPTPLTPGAPASTPGTPATPLTPPAAPDKYAGLSPVVALQQKIADLNAAREQSNRLDTEGKVADLQQTHSRENATWAADQAKQATADRVKAYETSAEYPTDTPEMRSRKISFIRDQIPYREPTQKTKTTLGFDETGHPAYITKDLSSDEVISTTPAPASAEESMVQSIMHSKKFTRDQAEAELGKIRIEGLRLGNESKEGSIEAIAALKDARETRTKILKEKQSSGGKFTPIQLEGIRKAAKSSALAKLKADPMALLRMSAAEKDQKLMQYEREYVEGTPGQEGIMKYEDLIKGEGGPGHKTPAQIAADRASAIRARMAAPTPAPAAAPGKRLIPSN
jgi:hypothetical protein